MFKIPAKDLETSSPADLQESTHHGLVSYIAVTNVTDEYASSMRSQTSYVR